MLEDSEIESILSANGSDQGATDMGSRVQGLLDAANAAGGLDNITAALVRIDQPTDGAE
jgi:serine/threonine protein phosphatase PrpC